MFFGEINRQAIGLIATLVGVGSLDKYLATAVPQIASLGRIANLMGQAAPDLKAFQLWVQQTGGNADTATNSFLKLSQTMQGFRSGMVIPDPTFLLGLSTIGGGVNDSPLALFEKYAAWTRGKTGPQQLQEGARLGFDTDTINAAVRAGPDAAKDLAAMKANLPSDADIKRVQDLQIAFHKLRQDVLGNANAMLYQASPALTGLLALVDQGVTKFPIFTRLALALATALTAIGLVKLPATALRLLLGAGGAGAATEGAAAAGTGVGLGAIAGALPGAAALAAADWAINQGGEAAGRWVGGMLGGAGAKPGPTAKVLGAAGLAPHEVAAVVGGFVPNRTTADRSNNPGNLVDPTTGKFMHFATREEGFAAMARQEIIDYTRHGQHTLRELIDDPHHGWSNEWAPGNTHASSMAYIASLSKSLGIGADQEYQMTPEFLSRLMLAQAGVERGGALPASQKALTDRAAQITIGTVVVNAGQATDARGIARHIKKALASELATQSNGALN